MRFDYCLVPAYLHKSKLYENADYPQCGYADFKFLYSFKVSKMFIT